MFRSASKINIKLLSEVVDCYENGKRVCKFCFYRRRVSRTVSNQGDRLYCHKCRKDADTVWAMPKSKLCAHFDDRDEVAIPIAPRDLLRKPHKPFSVCQRREHEACFEMAGTSEIWYAHTIEELVVWTIEREYGESTREGNDICQRVKID